MKVDLEAEMIKALEGKFFMDPSCKASDEMNGMQREIFEAQKFGPRKIIRSSMAIIDETEITEGFIRPRMLREAEIRSKKVKTIEDMKTVVAACYSVPKSEIEKPSNNKRACEAKRHFYWALMRHFPEMSSAEIGRQVGKNHTTVLSLKKAFEKNKDKYKNEIEYVDSIMGGKV